MVDEDLAWNVSDQVCLRILVRKMDVGFEILQEW
jgi:hypothetical protein